LRSEVASIKAASRLGRLPDEDLKRLEYVTKIIKNVASVSPKGAADASERQVDLSNVPDEELLLEAE
jgi:hypothetical protein